MSSTVPSSLSRLRQWLMHEPIGSLRGASERGELSEVIPEWERLRGPWNIQHHAHHFPLDDHTLKVVEATQRSPFFQTLTAYEQWLTALSALLHDIEKNTGPQRLYESIPVDKLHPLKSALSTLTILSRLGMPLEDVLRCMTLIHHHQAFGQLFIRYGETGDAHDEDLLRIARKLRSVRLTHCLLALSEGDIRSVQAENAYFTPGVEVNLNEYGQRVCAMLASRWPCQPLVPYHAPLTTLTLETQEPCVSHGISYWAISTWEHLVQLLSDEPWGGAWALPLSQANICMPSDAVAVLGLRCLPENVTYIGPITGLPQSLSMPAKLTHPTRLSMADFYALWDAQTSPTESLHAPNLAQQQDIDQFNRPMGLNAQDDSERITRMTANVIPLDGSSDWVMVGTRPLVQSLWLESSPPSKVQAILKTALPVLGSVITPSAYAYGRL